MEFAVDSGKDFDVADFICSKCGVLCLRADDVTQPEIECMECGHVNTVPPTIHFETRNSFVKKRSFSEKKTIGLLIAAIGIFSIAVLASCCGFLGVLGSGRPTKSEFRAKKADYERQAGEALICTSQKHLRKVFGEPDHVSSYSDSYTWTYRCSDGRVHVRFTQVPFSDLALLKSIDEG
ncbi:hypothetical protein [Novipirellula maiorica]|uniref:hypothetical protein n=1 Tax=Novipirellula maiorica TaxID=1265734 RepID=UPI0005949C56|nr:hypothetical protein [Rhodopirellula maiorica]